VPIFKLIPLDPKNHNWWASIYRDEVIIRAESEDRARKIAYLAFGRMPERIPGFPVPCDPWERSTGTASCEPLKDANFDQEGEEAILSPAMYDGKWLR